MRNSVVRGSAVRLTDRAIWETLKRPDNPPGMKRDEWLTLRGLAYSFDRVLRKGHLSIEAARHFVTFARTRMGEESHSRDEGASRSLLRSDL